MWLTRIVLPIAPQLAQDLAHLDAGPRVEAGCRLVEDEERRIMDDRMGQAEPLRMPRERLSTHASRLSARPTISSSSPIIVGRRDAAMP